MNYYSITNSYLARLASKKFVSNVVHPATIPTVVRRNMTLNTNRNIPIKVLPVLRLHLQQLFTTAILDQMAEDNLQIIVLVLIESFFHVEFSQSKVWNKNKINLANFKCIFFGWNTFTTQAIISLVYCFLTTSLTSNLMFLCGKCGLVVAIL